MEVQPAVVEDEAARLGDDVGLGLRSQDPGDDLVVDRVGDADGGGGCDEPEVARVAQVVVVGVEPGQGAVSAVCWS